MQHPDYIIQSRRLLPRRLAAGLLATQLALVSFGQTPAADSSADSDKDKDKDKTVVLEKLTVAAGFAGSLAAATEAKQNNAQLTEVVMSEDIGKLPDVSIADALTRLTGLTTQRVNGRSQGISIRGLTGDFTVTTLNGREQVSSSLNRSVEFDNYPAELLNAVVVYKTAAANQTSQGLAGTVDLQTVRPLSTTGRTIAVSGYYQTTEYKDLTPGADGTGNRLNLNYIDQFADGKVGLAIGYAHSNTPWAGKQFQAWGYPQDSAGNYTFGGSKSYVRSSDIDRDGLMAVLEWKPSDHLHSTIDVYYSKLDETQYLRGMEIPAAFWSSAQLQPGYTTSGGLITGATLKNIQPVIRNDVVTKKNDVVAVGWNLEMGDRSGWLTVFDVGYSKITRTEQNLETYSGLGFAGGAANPDTLTYTQQAGEIPVMHLGFDYSTGAGLSLTDPQGWGTGTLPTTGMEGYYKVFDAKDELGQVKLLTKHDLKKWFSDVELGVAYTDRFKRDGEKPTGFIYNSNGKPSAPLPAQVGTTDYSFLGLGKIYAYDPLAAYNGGAYTFYPSPNGDVIANRWSVEEKIWRPYVQLNIDTKMFGVPVKGNLGLMAISVDQESEGKSTTGNGSSLVVTPVSGGATYTDFAPALNLNFFPKNDWVVRFGLARQIARPRMYDMRVSRTYSYNPANAGQTDPSQSPWSGDGGNPELKPWKSNSLDLSVEKYFKHNKGYVSLAYFYKDLKNYIYQQGVVADFSGYPISGSATPVQSTGTATSPQNGQGGSLQGVEFTLSLPSELLSESIKGFGVVFGGAWTDSKIEPWGPGSGDSPISGLSKKVANITLYYERGGFSARIGEWYRSDYRAYITNFGAPNFKGDVTNTGFATAQPEKNVSAQVSYAFRKGSLKGLSVFVQGYNLNNEPLITYNNGDARQVVNYQTYGASYSIGAAYKF